MNIKPHLAIIFTSLLVVACGRGCTKDDESLVDILPTVSPFVTPTTQPTIELKVFIVPDSARQNTPFQVRAYLPESEQIDVYADSYRLGMMGWDRNCRCKTLVIKLNTAGERTIRFVSNDKDLASEMILMEAE